MHLYKPVWNQLAKNWLSKHARRSELNRMQKVIEISIQELIKQHTLSVHVKSLQPRLAVIHFHRHFEI